MIRYEDARAILNKLVGERSANEIARQIGITPGHLSKFRSGAIKTVKPHVLDEIEKLGQKEGFLADMSETVKLKIEFSYGGSSVTTHEVKSKDRHKMTEVFDKITALLREIS